MPSQYVINTITQNAVQDAWDNHQMPDCDCTVKQTITDIKMFLNHPHGDDSVCEHSVCETIRGLVHRVLDGSWEVSKTEGS